MGGARVTTLVTLRKCTLGNKREIKTLKFVSASTKGFKGGLAWIKPSKKDMVVTFSYSPGRRDAAMGRIADRGCQPQGQQGWRPESGPSLGGDGEQRPWSS